MNINIRYINNIDGINVWKNRKNKLLELLLNKCSDVFFFQEMTKPQSNFISLYSYILNNLNILLDENYSQKTFGNETSVCTCPSQTQDRS